MTQICVYMAHAYQCSHCFTKWEILSVLKEKEKAREGKRETEGEEKGGRETETVRFDDYVY